MSTQITFLGHSGALIEDDSLSVMTDPAFSRRALWMKRPGETSIRPEEISQPSVILVTQAHYDHFDIPSFKYFPITTPIIVPAGMGKLASKLLPNPVFELIHGATQEIREGLRITAFPVTNFNFRLSGLTYRNANGYWIEIHDKKIFFAGTTLYRDDFQKFRNPDIAFLPIGPCRPVWLMRKWAMSPADALRLAQEIETRCLIPIHWDSCSSTERPDLDPLSVHPMKDCTRILKAGEMHCCQT